VIDKLYYISHARVESLQLIMLLHKTVITTKACMLSRKRRDRFIRCRQTV